MGDGLHHRTDKKMKAAVAILSVGCCLFSPVMAEETYQQEVERAGQTYSQADANLNAAWKKVSACYAVAAVDGDPSELKASKTSLLQEERLWIKWKDAACDYWDHGFGTIGTKLSGPECLTEIVVQRTKTLNDLANELCGR